MIKKIKPPLSYKEFYLLRSTELRRHKKVINILEERLKEFQKSCPHSNKYFNQDPAGGNDSYYICCDCDKIL